MTGAGVGQQAVVQKALQPLAAFATRDEPLAPHTTYKVGGPADVFAVPRNDDELCALAEAVRRTGLPTLVVGRGSNLLVADAGFRGIAISLAAMAEWIELHDTRSRCPCSPVGVLRPGWSVSNGPSVCPAPSVARCA